MANTVQIDIVSAEESIFSGMAEFVAAPSIMGEVGIYPHHAPMITALKSGSVRIKLAEKNEDQLILSLVEFLKSNLDTLRYYLILLLEEMI